MFRRSALVLILLVGISVAQSKPPKTPTLGFNYIKDASPLLDEDVYFDELELKKTLPGNQNVYDKRAMHEAALMNEFLDEFKESKECKCIAFYLKEGKKPSFTVQIDVMGHDDHSDNQTWIWILGWPSDPSPADKKPHGVGGMGSQSSAKLTAKDVCLTIWDDVDPNHFNRPGGKIE